MIISCLGIIVYSNTFHGTFQFDDKVFIIDNSTLRNIADLHNIWNYYPCRFLTFLSFALNFHFHQLNVFGYHLVNLGIHLLTAILVWWLTLLTLSTPALKNTKITRHADLIALLTGLVFVSHPLQTEAVTYIWQRAASMATMFYLASLCLYVKSRLKPNKLYYFSSLMAAILTMFTKETAITLPLMIILYEFCFLNTGKKLNWKYLAPFLLTIFIIPLTMLFNTGTAPKEPTNISSYHYLLTQFRVIITYIRLLFVPLHQNLDYDYPVVKSIFELPAFFSFLFLVILLFWAKRLFPKYRLISFSIFWFFLTLLPESSFFPLQDVIFEHRLYLPMAGYSIFLVCGVYYMFYRHSERSEESKDILRSFTSFRMTLVALLLIIACNSILTYQRNSIWKNEITLLNDVIRKSPHKERPFNNRGLVLSGQGNLDQAIADFSQAIKINPEYTNAYINRGFMYNKQGDLNRAIVDYGKAIEINPRLAEAYIDRGNVFVKSGNLKQAVPEFEKAVKISPDNPNFADTYYDLGFIYYKMGNYAQAVANYSKFIEMNPNDPEAYNNRAVSYFQLKEYDKSWDDVNMAEKLGSTANPQLINALKQVTGK